MSCGNPEIPEGAGFPIEAFGDDELRDTRQLRRFYFFCLAAMKFAVKM